MGNKEVGKSEGKILRQEEFKVDCPRKITVGDPSYFKEFSGERLKPAGRLSTGQWKGVLHCWSSR